MGLGGNKMNVYVNLICQPFMVVQQGDTRYHDQQLRNDRMTEPHQHKY